MLRIQSEQYFDSILSLKENAGNVVHCGHFIFNIKTHSYIDPISLTEFPLECVPVVGKLLCGIVTDEKVLHVECAIRWQDKKNRDMYSPDTYPKDTYPPVTYPLDTYPLDIYLLGHIPPVTYPLDT